MVVLQYLGMKRILYNNKILLERRKLLRNNPTKTEGILWFKLNKNQLGFRFFRQYSVGPYILDFYCPKKRLSIEIDGRSHDSTDAKIYDNERSEYLKSLNIKIIRFRNEEIIKNIKSVIARISRVVTSP